MCEVLRISHSGFYAWLKRNPFVRREKEVKLLAEIRRIHAESRGTYGSPRVHAKLQQEGLSLSRRRVEKLMKAYEIRGKMKRRFKVMPKSLHRYQRVDNLLRRNFVTSAPDKVWAGDATCVWTNEGWLYLSVVIDLYSRQVIGWGMAKKLSSELSIASLNMAISRRRPKAGLMYHSDQGMENACYAFRSQLEKHKITQSMSRKANCWDNAVVESFFHTMKLELSGERYATRAQARTRIFEWIEVFYNRQRLHSTLGYRAPAVYEQENAS